MRRPLSLAASLAIVGTTLVGCGSNEPTAGEAHWRHRLMSMGHDPLKPVG